MKYRNSQIEERHHTDMQAKILIREDANLKNCVWMPFCGRGDILDRTLWPTDRVWACDNNASMCHEFIGRFGNSYIQITRAESYKFNDFIFSHLDIDPFENPFPALEHGLKNARLADDLTIAITDGTRQRRVRKHCLYRFDFHEFQQTLPDWVKLQEKGWPDEIIVWLQRIRPDRIFRMQNDMTVKWMRYMLIRSFAKTAN